MGRTLFGGIHICIPRFTTMSTFSLTQSNFKCREKYGFYLCNRNKKIEIYYNKNVILYLHALYLISKYLKMLWLFLRYMIYFGLNKSNNAIMTLNIHHMFSSTKQNSDSLIIWSSIVFIK